MFLASLSVEYEANRYGRFTGWPAEFVLHSNADQSLISVGCRFDFMNFIMSFDCFFSLAAGKKGRSVIYF